jgi:cobalamin synthase
VTPGEIANRIAAVSSRIGSLDAARDRARYLTARRGGLTGDAHGALAVIVETLALCGAVALRPGSG